MTLLCSVETMSPCSSAMVKPGGENTALAAMIHSAGDKLRWIQRKDRPPKRHSVWKAGRRAKASREHPHSDDSVVESTPHRDRGEATHFAISELKIRIGIRTQHRIFTGLTSTRTSHCDPSQRMQTCNAPLGKCLWGQCEQILNQALLLLFMYWPGLKI